MDITALSKEELISVIANMHDSIQDWGPGYGMTVDEGTTMKTIGSAATKHCCDTNSWKLPEIK